MFNLWLFLGGLTVVFGIWAFVESVTKRVRVAIVIGFSLSLMWLFCIGLLGMYTDVHTWLKVALATYFIMFVVIESTVTAIINPKL